MEPKTELLNGKKAAHMLGLSYDWLYYARRTPGKGPPYYRLGRRYFYSVDDIRSWLQERKRK